MSTSASPAAKFSITQWLIIIIASIGFLFDTYELLMTPLVATSAIAELLNISPKDPTLTATVTVWVGRLLWISALCGGIFGLLGGWLVDRFGRKRIMALSILLYSVSPFLAAYSSSLPMFLTFRCITFVGVCIEFVAAVTWLSEVIGEKAQRERWLGITQAFASLGGVAVTAVSVWINSHAKTFSHVGLPVGGDGVPGAWRYLLMSGVLPAIPIALLLPFVPESQTWKSRKTAGTLQRPRFSALFAPELRRVTIVTAILSACAYGIAFGALQVTVASVTPGLPELRTQAADMAAIPKANEALSKQIASLPEADPATNEIKAQMKANAQKLDKAKAEIKERRDTVQLHQEMGGLVGRILLAVLLIAGLARLKILRLFQIPALIIVPLTYFYLFPKGGEAFLLAYAVCGLVTVAQFSYFGEYLPKVFPLHLRGTGGSFATNVGGRMIGTSMAVVTTQVIAPLLAGSAAAVKPLHVAQAAGYVGAAMALIGFLTAFFLPEPKEASAAPEKAYSIT